MGTLQASLSLTAKVLALGSLKQICCIVPHKILSTQSHDKQWGNTATVQMGGSFGLGMMCGNSWAKQVDSRNVPISHGTMADFYVLWVIFFHIWRDFKVNSFETHVDCGPAGNDAHYLRVALVFQLEKLVLLPILPDTRTLHAISCRGLWLCGCALEEWEVWWQFCLHGQPGLQRSLMFSKRR